MGSMLPYIAYMDPMGYRLFFLTLIHYPHLNIITVACTWFIDFLLTLEIMPSTNVEISTSSNFVDSPKTIWWFPQWSWVVFCEAVLGIWNTWDLTISYIIQWLLGGKLILPYDSYNFPYLLLVLTTLMSCSCDSVKMFPKIISYVKLCQTSSDL